MSKKGEYEIGKSKALRVAIIGCFAVFTVFAMIASLLFGSADISFGVIPAYAYGKCPDDR